MKPRKLDQIITPGWVAVTAAAVFPVVTLLLGVALVRGNTFGMYAAWIAWVTDMVLTLAAANVYYADRKHREQATIRADEALTVEMERIVAAEHQRIGGLY